VNRSEYIRGELNEETRPTDPLTGLEVWIREATEAGAPEPTAMCLATSSTDAQPSARYVLMRGIDERGLKFYTNYASRKGEELDDNPRVAAVFWWPLLERQIRVEGYVERLSAEESDDYFANRPIKSRFAAAASPQSREVDSREELEQMVETLVAQYPDGPPRPEGWGGFRIVPDRIEFWQGRRARLHDRFQYSREGEGWSVSRLAP
jgi:pyridoxamine 5'-phosphate oxidase